MKPTLEQIEAMMSGDLPAKPDVRGTLVFWNRGRREDGRNYAALFGIISLPTPLAERFGKDERLQHLVSGAERIDGSLLLTLSDTDGQRYPEHLRARRMDELMTSPIWRA